MSNTISTHTFQVEFQHAHFKRSFNTHISSAVSTHAFQIQFQHTHFRHSFNTQLQKNKTKKIKKFQKTTNNAGELINPNFNISYRSHKNPILSIIFPFETKTNGNKNWFMSISRSSSSSNPNNEIISCWRPPWPTSWRNSSSRSRLKRTTFYWCCFGWGCVLGCGVGEFEVGWWVFQCADVMSILTHIFQIRFHKHTHTFPHSFNTYIWSAMSTHTHFRYIYSFNTHTSGTGTVSAHTFQAQTPTHISNFSNTHFTHFKLQHKLNKWNH